MVTAHPGELLAGVVPGVEFDILNGGLEVFGAVEDGEEFAVADGAEVGEVAAVGAIVPTVFQQEPEPRVLLTIALAAAHQAQVLAHIGVPEDHILRIEPLHILELEPDALVGQYPRSGTHHLLQRGHLHATLPVAVGLVLTAVALLADNGAGIEKLVALTEATTIANQCLSLVVHFTPHARNYIDAFSVAPCHHAFVDTDSFVLLHSSFLLNGQTTRCRKGCSIPLHRALSRPEQQCLSITKTMI